MEMELESIMLPGIDPQRPIVIAGPCSAETEEQVMETAKGKVFKYGDNVDTKASSCSAQESGNLVLNRVDSKESERKACNG